MENLLVKRVCATLFDILVVTIPTVLLSLTFQGLKLIPQVTDFLNNFNFLTQLSTSYLVMFAIYDYVYMSKFHTTIGKSRLHIHVETEKGRRRLSQKTQMIRSLSKAVSLFGLYAIPSVLSLLMMTTNYSTSIHDRLARTEVWENNIG
ncbi:RDD family protein [Anaerorhabdus sp.]|jgi:hypothetical protein|uniref:RDD family protein n=1 Tax=Anaerorhabdus sp. TaxID=1872524 RepID=UPI002FC81EB2